MKDCIQHDECPSEGCCIVGPDEDCPKLKREAMAPLKPAQDEPLVNDAFMCAEVGMPTPEPKVFRLRRKHVTCTDGVNDRVLSDVITEYVEKKDYDVLELRFHEAEELLREIRENGEGKLSEKLIARIDAHLAEPREGMALVPTEPTAEMIDAGLEARRGADDTDHVGNIYHDMFAAAPGAREKGKE